jgi:6-phosphogluconolactonase/glucosamine-6-phosphate isomerase/deaminase
MTPIVIQSAKYIFVFVKGKEKGEVLAQLMANPDGVESEPILLVLGATFILNTVAFAKLD